MNAILVFGVVFVLCSICNCVSGGYNKSEPYSYLSPIEATLSSPWDQVPWSRNYLPLPSALLSTTAANPVSNPEPPEVIRQTSSTLITSIPDFDSIGDNEYSNDYSNDYRSEVVVNANSQLDEEEEGEDGSQFQRDVEYSAGGLPKGKQRKRIISRKKPNAAKTSSIGNEYSNEYRIKKWLFQTLSYDKSTRPVRQDETPTTLYIGMSLYHILDTNEKFQTLSALIAVRLRWMDEYLRWNSSEFNGIDQIWIPAPQIWTPDIFINNFADDSFQDFMNTQAIVSSSGHVLWMFPAIVKVYCTLDVEHFPFDDQRCSIVFISWTYNGLKLNVTYNESEQQAIYYTPKNQEWYVEELTVVRNEKIYACCPEPYPDVTFTIHMTRRSLFYVVNLIFPCLLIYAVSFLGFFLPVESGEKVNLEITILLALVVFLLIVGETLPPTPDAIPALGLLFGLTMIMVSIALVMAVVVTNLFLRHDSRHRIPLYIRRIFLRTETAERTRMKPTRTEKYCGGGGGVQDGLVLDDLSVFGDQIPKRKRSRNQRRTRTRLDHPGARRSRFSFQGSGSGRDEDSEDFEDDDEEDEERREAETISQEWQGLAKVVDRIFFWMFLVSSVGSLMVMFIRIPQ